MHGNQKQIQRAADLIATSKRPVLYVGGGTIMSGAARELTELARKMNCPVTTTLHGLGAFPENDRLSLGMLGMHGTWYSNKAVSECDLLIAVGARFDDRVTGKTEAFAPYARKVHIDIDPAAISKNVKVDVPIVGDVKNVLQKLIQLVTPLDITDWLEEIERWKSEHSLRFKAGKKIRFQSVMQKLAEITNGDAIIVTDVGQHQMWAAQMFTYVHPRSHITSGGLGTMGFSLPAAMGAAFGRTDLPIISISGDGGIQMNSQELATLVEHKVPLKIFVINNGYLGMVRQWQELFWKRRYSHVALMNPNFVKLAEAYGARGVEVTETSKIESVIREALSYNEGPVLVEFKVVPEDNVFPMIPSGQSVSEMLDVPDELMKHGENDDPEARIVLVSKGKLNNYQEGTHEHVTDGNAAQYEHTNK
jgi:acetolactate synthase I/II/III large subunit